MTVERRDPELTDLKRRVASGVLVGKVSQVDHELNRYRVKAGELETDWLPSTVARSGKTKHFSSLDVGEQVVLASPSGDLSQAVILGSVATDTTQNGTKASEHRTTYADGTVVEYDDEKKAMSVKLADGGTSTTTVGGVSFSISKDAVAIKVGGVTMTVNGEGVQVKGGGITTEGGTISHDGVDVGKAHRHEDVQSGAALSGPPVGAS